MEPSKIVAGDTVGWTKSLPDYPAASYTLKYELRGPSSITITATGSGTEYTVAVLAATSDDYVPGIYSMYGVVSAGAVRHTVFQGTIEVVENPTEIQPGTDTRGHARRTLALIEAAIENYAANPYQTITIAGRTKSNWSMSELLSWRDRYIQEAKREADAERVANGIPTRRRIFTRFSSGVEGEN
jgi:hypothetical protein